MFAHDARQDHRHAGCGRPVVRSVPTAGERYRMHRSRWHGLGAGVIAVAAFLAVGAMLSSGLGLVDLARWAAAQQKAFHAMMGDLIALKDGGPLALVALLGACLVYGFVHAAVPGHGKFLVAGAGVASRLSTLRLVSLAVAGSLTQALTAIVLVYGSFALFNITAGWAMGATDRVLIPLSTLAILAIGLVLARRGMLGLAERRKHTCNHRHGPTVEEAERVQRLRDAVMLVIGIGLRPCTGAIFVLVAAWRMDLLIVGALGAVVMALGTGALTALVAVSATTARGATVFAAGMERSGVTVPLLQILGGGAIVLASIALLLAGFVQA